MTMATTSTTPSFRRRPEPRGAGPGPTIVITSENRPLEPAERLAPRQSTCPAPGFRLAGRNDDGNDVHHTVVPAKAGTQGGGAGSHHRHYLWRIAPWNPWSGSPLGNPRARPLDSGSRAGVTMGTRPILSPYVTFARLNSIRHSPPVRVPRLDLSSATIGHTDRERFETPSLLW